MSATAVKLDEHARTRMEVLAAQRQIGFDVLVAEAVKQFLEREQTRDTFREAAFESWAQYQATGLHATSAEVDEWLAKLERGEDAAPPACHG